MMQPGVTWRLLVPPEVGYDKHSPPPILPGALSIYELELVRVEPPQPPDPQLMRKSGSDHRGETLAAAASRVTPPR